MKKLIDWLVGSIALLFAPLFWERPQEGTDDIILDEYEDKAWHG